MKGLLLKDAYTLVKQLRIFMVILIIWSVIPNFNASSFAIFYAAILPVTALAYDERSKWSILAKMMPYSAKDIVLSKYVLGYIFIAITSVICLVASRIFALIGVQTEDATLLSIFAIICVSLIFSAINLPMMFRFGVEKGRLFLLIIVFAIVGGGTFAANIVTKGPVVSTSISVVASLILALAAVVTNIISIFISISIYKNKAN